MTRPALLALLVVAFTVLVAWVEHNRAEWWGLSMGWGSWGNVAVAFGMAAVVAVVVEAVCRPWPVEGVD